jgi:hypothetical protein
MQDVLRVELPEEPAMTTLLKDRASGELMPGMVHSLRCYPSIPFLVHFLFIIIVGVQANGARKAKQ